MQLNPFAHRQNDLCELHGKKGNSGNWMLLGMILVSFALIVWHVWAYGPVSRMVPAQEIKGAFPVLLGNEIWDLLFSKKGVLIELWEVLPYFLVGILIAGYLRTYKIAVKLQASLRKYGVASVFLASFVGIITPLCACGTLTTAISLLLAGIPLAPVMALMVTSPLMSPTTYLLTLNDLGPEWTVIRTASAFLMGIFAGLLAHFLSKVAGFRDKEIFMEGKIIRGDFHDDDYPDERLRCSCRRSFGNRVAVRTGNNFLVFLAKSSEMLWGVGKYVVVGVTVGAVVERYMPKEWVYELFGNKGPFNIVWVTLASVPIFLHQISASSIIYHIKGSLAGTLDGGAALAFMIGGPVTAVPTMVLFWTFFRKRVFFLYMFACLTGTMLIAYAFQWALFLPGVDMGNPLLKKVSTLTSGPAAELRKTGADVRMVLEQGGRGAVAAYSNEAEGVGGVVFDASYGRFTREAAVNNDDRNYIVNIAEWLEQQAPATGKKSILVYVATDIASNAPSLIRDKVQQALQQKGFTVSIVNRKDIPLLTEKALADYDQLWLFCDNKPFSSGELDSIATYNAKGRGLLAVPILHQDSGNAGYVEINRLSSRYGVQFSGNIRNSPDQHVSVIGTALERSAGLLGKALKIVRKA